MLNEHSPEVMRVLAPYYDTIGRLNRAAADMDAEFAEAQDGRDKEYEERKAEQDKQRARYEDVRDEVNKQVAEQRSSTAEGEERKPNVWLEHQPHNGAEELDFVPEDDQADGPDDVDAPVSRPAVSPRRTVQQASRHRFAPNVDADYDDEDEDFMNRSWLE